MHISTISLSSTSPLPPERDELGARLDTYAPASDANGPRFTLISRPVFMGVVVSLAGLGLLLFLTGCTQSGTLQQSRSVRTTQLAPLTLEASTTQNSDQDPGLVGTDSFAAFSELP